MRAPSAVLLSLAIVLALGPAAGADEPVVAGQNNVLAPKKTKTILPEYPPEAQARGQRGIVIVELVIDPTGKVSSAQIIRSVPPFDEAALAAVRQWEYEVTKVDGKPVSVKLTVPITFAMKIPEIASRQEGIPELRAGAFPPLSADAREIGTATAEITLGPDGNVEELRILDGPPAYADSLARALRTWRFAPEASEATVTFQVHAQFNPTRTAGSKVEFRLDGLRRSESLASAATQAPAAVTPAPGPSAAATTPPMPAVPGHDNAVSPKATPTATAPAAVPPATAPTPTVPPPTAPPQTAVPPTDRPGPSGGAPAPPVTRPAPPSPTAVPPISKPMLPAAASFPAPSSTALNSAPPGTPAPAIEVLTVAPPPEPAESGLSAIRDVTLSPGVPDLTRGRRPVPPPLARMAQATGAIDVAFSVDAAGIASVKGSNGPEIFKRAAEQAVSSWTFRRTRAERIFLVAEFKYTTDAASATVRPDVR